MCRACWGEGGGVVLEVGALMFDSLNGTIGETELGAGVRRGSGLGV